MSSAVAVRKWDNVKFAESATRASYEAVWDVERERQIVACAVASVAPRPSRATRGMVVELKPRQFSETAEHFLRVAMPVEWSHDEADID
jgi:hypothetical protein